MKVSRNKLDRLFSLLVRERADWTCEACGKQFNAENTQGLHCSHFVGRRHRATRWSGTNAAAQCFTCHRRFTERPTEFAAWIEKHLGRRRCEHLARASNVVAKFTAKDMEAIAKHLSSELRRLQQERMNGKRGVLAFETAPEIVRLEGRING